MIKLLSTICLILAIVLSPPAVLAVVSNSAVPGDLTYPIKRGLEDVIYAVASLNPTTKAWFAGARSDKRFEEVTTLLAKGKSADRTLQELVEQTQVAALQINQISDPVQKDKMVRQLSDSITKYDVGLAQISQKSTQPPVIVVEQPSLAPSAPAVSALPVSAPQDSIEPRETEMPKSLIQDSPPSPAGVSPSVVPQPVMTPVITQQSSVNSDIDRVREELGRIKDELKQTEHEQAPDEKKLDREKKEKNEKEKKDNDSLKKVKVNSSD